MQLPLDLDLGTVLLAIAAALAGAVCVSLMSSAGALPPGPPGLPLLGNTLDLTNPTFHRKLLVWANQYGGLFTLKIPGQLLVVLNDPALFLPLLGKGSKELNKAKTYEFFNPVHGPKGHSSVFTVLDRSDYWNAVRKTMAPSFSNDCMRKSFQPTYAMCIKFCDKIAELVSPSGYTTSIDMMDLIVRSTFDIIGETGFGIDFHALDTYGKTNEALDNLHGVLEEMSKLLVNPARSILKKLFPFMPEFARAHQQATVCWKLWDRVAKELKERGEPEADDMTIGANLLRIRDPKTGEPLSHGLLNANIAVMVVAGFDTGAHTILWALYDIACYPEHQAAIKAELAANNLLHQKGSPHKDVDFSTVSSLPYFNACLKESMRMNPVAATGTSRVLDEATTVGSYTLPAKTTIWVPFITSQNSVHNWQDAAVYSPKRWLEEEEPDQVADSLKSSTQPPRANKAAYLPFSEGRRNCLGMNQAYMSTRTVLLTLLSRFWFEVDETKMKDREYQIENSALALVMTLGDGLHLKLKPHA
eukprot:gene23953-9524_t